MPNLRHYLSIEPLLLFSVNFEFWLKTCIFKFPSESSVEIRKKLAKNE